jgi:hypothetical protein
MNAVPQQTPQSPFPSGPSFQLYQLLNTKSGELGDMYWGAYCSLSNSGNPECLIHSAHSFRELIEKMPAYIDVETPAHNEKLTPKVNELRDCWNNTKKHLICSEDGNYSGEITRTLNSFLKKCDVFFDWHKVNNPLRNEEAKRVLDKLDVAKRQLPQPIQKLRIQEWASFREYFQKVAHHGYKDITIDEFISWVDTFNTFLLDRFAPRFFEDAAEIDKIIEEGEKNAE